MNILWLYRIGAIAELRPPHLRAWTPYTLGVPGSFKGLQWQTALKRGFLTLSPGQFRVTPSLLNQLKSVNFSISHKLSGPFGGKREAQWHLQRKLFRPGWSLAFTLKLGSGVWTALSNGRDWQLEWKFQGGHSLPAKAAGFLKASHYRGERPSFIILPPETPEFAETPPPPKPLHQPHRSQLKALYQAANRPVQGMGRPRPPVGLQKRAQSSSAPRHSGTPLRGNHPEPLWAQAQSLPQAIPDLLRKPSSLQRGENMVTSTPWPSPEKVRPEPFNTAIGTQLLPCTPFPFLLQSGPLSSLDSCWDGSPILRLNESLSGGGVEGLFAAEVSRAYSRHPSATAEAESERILQLLRQQGCSWLMAQWGTLLQSLISGLQGVQTTSPQFMSAEEGFQCFLTAIIGPQVALQARLLPSQHPWTRESYAGFKAFEAACASNQSRGAVQDKQGHIAQALNRAALWFYWLHWHNDEAIEAGSWLLKQCKGHATLLQKIERDVLSPELWTLEGAAGALESLSHRLEEGIEGYRFWTQHHCEHKLPPFKTLEQKRLESALERRLGEPIPLSSALRFFALELIELHEEYLQLIQSALNSLQAHAEGLERWYFNLLVGIPSTLNLLAQTPILWQEGQRQALKAYEAQFESRRWTRQPSGSRPDYRAANSLDVSISAALWFAKVRSRPPILTPQQTQAWMAQSDESWALQARLQEVGQMGNVLLRQLEALKAGWKGIQTSGLLHAMASSALPPAGGKPNLGSPELLTKIRSEVSNFFGRKKRAFNPLRFAPQAMSRIRGQKDSFGRVQRNRTGPR